MQSNNPMDRVLAGCNIDGAGPRQLKGANCGSTAAVHKIVAQAITANSATNLTADSTPDLTVDSATDLAGNSTANPAAHSTSNLSANSATNLAVNHKVTFPYFGQICKDIRSTNGSNKGWCRD